jgi:hypothetical protein
MTAAAHNVLDLPAGGLTFADPEIVCLAAPEEPICPYR